APKGPPITSERSESRDRSSHLVEDFCTRANLHCNSSHLTATTEASRAVSVAEAAAIGTVLWSDVVRPIGSGTT
ncbi:MAG: hypothetical protein ACREA0_27635, partial [bacterium]